MGQRANGAMGMHYRGYLPQKQADKGNAVKIFWKLSLLNTMYIKYGKAKYN